MKTLKDWTLQGRDGAAVTLLTDGGRRMRIAVLERDLIRVSLTGRDGWRLGRSWSVAPNGDVPFEGRSRDDLTGFSCPDYDLSDTDEGLVIDTGTLRLQVLRPLQLVWQAKVGDEWRVFASDRPTGAYMAGIRDHAHGHFLRRHPSEQVFGLGEKSGDLERSGRRFEMRNLDAMGYDAERTDPLYKHIPVTLTRTPDAGSFSVFYDNLACCWFDLGNELDNYHAPYRAYRAEDGDLDYYMAWSPDLAGLTRRQAWLTGGTAFMPRWALGYSGSTMSYTDAPDAQAQVQGFLDRITEHALPCDSFQMSSGYTSIGPKRYVFNWNTDKFPDIDAMTARFADADLHLIANIKPCMLHDHPRYAEAASAGLFIRDSEADRPEISVFWDDEGSHLDFTNPATIDWWKSNVTAQLLEHGIGSTWNDNNEYEIWDRAARCHGFGDPIDVALIRPLQPVLMTRASRDAQAEHAPHLRPYLISRSGAPGIQRYAQTWTGDNRTDWKTLRYNNRMGLGLSMSGIFNIGHDVGGFSGPRPGPELFLRWVQNGIFHPRFTIHSWNDDATVNEPWMYPRILPHIRAALALRGQLIPYLYTLSWQATQDHQPILRPTLVEYEGDPACHAECDEFMLGPDLLVATVIEEGATTRRLHLPDNGSGWWDFHTGAFHRGGQTIELPVDLGSMPLFVRAGAALPLSGGCARAKPETDTTRRIALFPAPGDYRDRAMLYEDDGVSVDALAGNNCRLLIETRADAEVIDVTITAHGPFRPFWPALDLSLPDAETRPLRVNGQPVTRIAFEDIPHAD
ncbi:glycoside hydrolase family 31 protein [Paracoccus sp. 1_MG-2023]|uniref:glycoside hydrolase family 31 protein n=1 Tax=unclassified Paracoccus (in: a-proteobacteria) TaxID=2688777 RepID=UPI001C08F0E7|nr:MULTISPECIES: TIM-barrel domain-containing protein [unclassified Paracoccus (in: a-proteobacteria)]MBU2956044.1 alpha-glucosidase [Paracoccus sp. C2R09]MDO6669450.1 glycoside hydrolase family 31 protein [Paracoccus sp. 1_MG-2023]